MIFRRRLTRALTLVVVLGASLAADARQERSTIKGADLDLLAEVRHIAEALETLRGQRFDRPPIAVRAPDEMRRVAAEIRALNVLHRDRLEARGRAWADIGLGQAATPAMLMTTLAADLQGVGFDPAGHRLMVSPDRLRADEFETIDPESDQAATLLLMTGVRVDEPLISHLLMHVRQHERVGGELLDETTDRLLARSAWFEGEANLVAIRRLFSGMGLADEILTTRFDPGGVLDGQLLPPAIEQLGGVERGLVEFVYLEGFARAVETFLRGGWAALDTAIDREVVTRDLLHPDRAGQPTATFAASVAPAEGMRRLDLDSIGEQAIVVLISTLTGKDNLGMQAGDGWVGDRLERWEGPDGPSRGITLWTTAWADERALDDFVYALERALTARFGPASATEGADTANRPTARSWIGGGKSHRVERDGLRVRLVVTPRG